VSERTELEYRVRVTGLEEATVQANAASRSAGQASTALQSVRTRGSSSLPVLMMSIRSLNATRLAVQQTTRAINELDPSAALYAFLNMIQVVGNLTALTRMLQDATGAASAAQAVLATLTGRWYLIPLAIAAGALVYSRVRSMEEGGPVRHTGVHYLHEGEYVVPTTQNIRGSTVQRIGPVFITFDREPREGLNRDRWLDHLGSHITSNIRRGG